MYFIMPSLLINSTMRRNMIAKRGLEMREVIAAIVPRRGIVIIGHEAISQSRIASFTPATLAATSAKGRGQGHDHRSGKRVFGMLHKEGYMVE
uniref:Uncharacterized protein n=1 Tax=Solanum lycopersicum TaxID=4081 RepID=A0A3Q7HAI2_SOLLC